MSLSRSLLLAGSLVLPAPLRAQRPEPRNIVYAEITTVLLLSAVSVNYERVLHQHFSVRGGFGAGYAIGAFGGTAGLGPQVMVNFFTRGPNSKFEVGAGASVIYQGREDWITTPAFSIGYRLQQTRAGFFLRAGLAWSYRFGIPLQISLGHSF